MATSESSETACMLVNYVQTKLSGSEKAAAIFGSLKRTDQEHLEIEDKGKIANLNWRLDRNEEM
jgi:hypothetical protein